MYWAILLSAANAQQSLEVFLQAAENHAVDGRIAEADADAARALRTEATAAWLPRVSANAGYTRNQVAVEASFPDGDGNLETVTITAKDQLEAAVRVDVPLLDLPAWSRTAAAGADVVALEHRLDASQRQSALAVTRAWYRLVAARALRRAAATSLDTARTTSTWIEARLDAGLTDELDWQRSLADLADREDAAAEAALEVALAERQLYVLSGVVPDPTEVALEDPVSAEAPLEAWLARVDRDPRVQAADADARAARARRTAAGFELVPSVGAFASERWTNAAGFGPNALWSAGVQATWNLDLVGPAAVAGANHRVVRASQLQVAATQDAETTVFESWHRVTSLTARLAATRAAEAASTRAATIARAGFEAGTRSQLELSQAERDRFRAEVDRIRAQADLHVELRALRLAVDLPPDLAVGP